jgi:OOP family OmpA-OmpF porin
LRTASCLWFRSLLGAVMSAAAGFSVFVAPSVVRGQASDAVDSEFSVQRFNPAPGPRNYFTTRGARTDGEMTWSAGFMANYGWEPFVVVSCIGANDCDEPGVRSQDVKVVENVVTADALASLTIIPRLQLGLRVPVTYVKGQGIDDAGQPLDGGIDAVGMGDLELEGKVRIYGGPKDPFVVGATLFGTAPLGHATSDGNYIGDPTPSGGLRAIIDGEHGPFSFGGNIGGVFKGSGRVGNTDIGHELRYGVGAGFRFSPVVRVLVDAFGATRFTANRGENSLEIDGGFQVTPLGSPITVSAGAGTGIVEGVGVPKLRAFLGVLFVHEVNDRDGDGIPDAKDKCPTDKEDFDGYEDSDGCPDLDNDLDSIPDAADKCPMQAEDFDGFEDEDGCPELDNDQDGVPDDSDRCPDKPETKNGFQDEDGCPDEKDTDQDGVPDEKDKCPNEPEDTDGFEDTDGCPDPDNDQDGIPDNEDECVDEPETMNGFEDEDGCPDEAPAGKAKKK